MRSSDLILRTSAILLLGIAAFVLMGSPTVAGELPPPGTDDVEAPAQEAQRHADPMAAVADGGPARPTDAAFAEPVFHKSERRDTTGWTSGVILGDIPLTPAVIDKIETIAVVVDELKNVRAGGSLPFRKVVPVPLGVGTPTFEVRDVPFSEYGYVVRVHSPGLNGGQSTVSITQESPLADGVKLPITPGSPFSILLRDQDRAPVCVAEVRMTPHGEPVGRRVWIGKSDNYGSVIFDNVLAGEYLVHVGTQAQPMMEPTLVNVQPGSYTIQGSMVLPQGTTILVPRGSPVLVNVTQPGGWPIAGALVQLRATDRRQMVELEAETDPMGKAMFPNLQTGNWDIEISKRDFERRQGQFEVKDGSPETEQRFELVRIR